MGFLVKTFKACVCAAIATKKNPRAERRGSFLVELDEATSNQLFQTLDDWNEQLKDAEDLIHTIDLGGPQP
ncbi:hypothetical protein [Oceanicaulis alexandrii]|uniref:hypothetical protein n=1 Tax=Oceanicaulis alexandrii TaxID=153233 RepID=UPI003B50120A